MGEVYRAEDTRLKRTVALKRLAPALRADSVYRRRFQEEAERASRFSDSHVAAVYDVLEEHGEIFLVLEYVEGETLRNRLRRPVSLEEFFTIAIQCGEALNAAHQRGIVHCDIKPENIMLTKSGQVKILDFGVAKHLPRSDQSSTIDRAGTFAGTPAYMSPEVLLEHAPDGRADVFSLGVVFYEMLTRQHPFLASSFVATTDRIRKENPAPIRIFNPGVPDSLEALVSKAIAKEPGQRYASGEELVKDLALVQAGLTPTTLQRVTPLVVQPEPKKKMWIFAAIVAIVIVCASAIYWRLSLRPQSAAWKFSTPLQLAILPFAPASEDSGAKAFGYGLTETLAAKLTQLTGEYPLQVVPPSEARAEGVTSVDQARKAFGVGLVLQGSLQGSGNQMRVTYSLVDAKTMRQLHADAVDANIADAFAVEDQVVDGVVRMLGIEVKSSDQVVLAAHGTSDPSAYDQYLRGRGYLLDYHKHENIESAISAFNRALTLDPKYAEAYAGVGKAYWLGYEEGVGASEWMEKAKSACNHAATSAPKLAEAYTCLGSVYRTTGEYEKAVTQFQKATTLDPTGDDAFRGLAEAFRKLNKPTEAEATFKKAISLRPQYWAGYSWLGVLYSQEGRYEDAAKEFQEVINLAPDNFRGYSDLGAMHIMRGRYPEAIAVLEKSVSIRPSGEAHNNLGTAYFTMRRYEEAVRNYEEGIKFERTSWLNWGNLGDAYYWTAGKRQQAANAYREAIRLTDQNLRVNGRDGRIWALRSTYLAMTDQKQEALASLQKALSFAPGNPNVQFRAALVFNHFGDTEHTMEWLRKAVAAGYPASVITSTPDFDKLRADPSFQAILRGTKQ